MSLHVTSSIIKPVTLDVQALKSPISQQALAKSLTEALADFMRTAGIKSMDQVQFKMPDGRVVDPKEFLNSTVKAGNISVIPALKSLAKNSQYMNSIIPTAGENNAKLAKGETKGLQKITIDLTSKTAAPKDPSFGMGSVQMVQAQVLTSNDKVNNMNQSSGETAVATVFDYTTDGISMMLKDMGYPKSLFQSSAPKDANKIV